MEKVSKEKGKALQKWRMSKKYYRLVCLLYLFMKKTTSLSNFRKIKISKWEKKEEQYLMSLVEKKAAKTTSDWNAVCEQMHEMGSRRNAKEYRAKWERQMNKAKQREANIDDAFKQQIYRNFELGKHPNQIFQDLNISYCTPYKIRNILIYKFNSIKTHLKKIVGASKAMTITIDDHQLFQFIKEQQLELISFSSFKALTTKWKQARSNKNSRELEALNQTFKQYNDNLHHYKRMFQQREKPAADCHLLSERQQRKRMNPSVQRSGAAYSHLSLVCKRIQKSEEKGVQFKNYDHRTLCTTPFEDELNGVGMIEYHGVGVDQRMVFDRWSGADNYDSAQNQDQSNFWPFYD